MGRLRIVGRADLLRALVAHRQPGRTALTLEELGMVAGYGVEPSLPREQRSTTTEVGSTPAIPRTERTDATASRLEVPLWQPRQLRWRAEPKREVVTPARVRADARVDEREREEITRVAPPSTPPLTPRRRVLPLLRRAFVDPEEGLEIDVDGLVRRMSRGEPIETVPRLRRRGWPSLLLLLDRDRALAPLWRDQIILGGWIGRLVGRPGLVVWWIDEHGPEHGVWDLRGKSVSVFDGVVAGLPVLALTDLGWHRGVEHRRSWLRVGRRLRRAGARIHALVPAPPARWTPTLAGVWKPIAWERPSTEDAEAAESAKRTARVGRLLAMASYAHRLEPGLLRTLRLALPRSAADVGTELDAWLHEDMAGQSPTATVVRPERAEALRAKLNDEDAAALVQAMQRWHWCRGRRPELWHSEVLALGSVEPAARAVPADERARAEAFVERLGARATAARSAGGRALPAGAREWLDYVQPRVPTRLWDSSSKVGEGLQRAWWGTHGDDEPPPLADPRLRAEVRDEQVGEPRQIDLRQVGRRLAAQSQAGTGSPVATIEAADEHVYVGDVRGGSTPIEAGAAVWLEGRPQDGVDLHTDRATLRLGAFVRPPWAKAIGRDRFGLWAELRHSVPYRMRWIAPGRFLMGSPQDERGPYDWEGPQHEVVITRGFWLGETPVTQALWKAVTGDNPSHFKGTERPVESVTWKDCNELVAALNESIREDHGERFRLPTEAEWEYACRAGTQTATYAGPLEILGERNAPGLDDIAWYGGNSGRGYSFEDGVDTSDWKDKQYPDTRAGTRRVGEKQPNPWGLHDMLGNVYEWCLDCWDLGSGYSGEPQQDPSGAATGDLRVFRGGSWHEHARGVRAASRYGYRPGGRGQDLGLRLVRGQAVERPGGAPDPEGPEGPSPGRRA